MRTLIEQIEVYDHLNSNEVEQIDITGMHPRKLRKVKLRIQLKYGDIKHYIIEHVVYRTGKLTERNRI